MNLTGLPQSGVILTATAALCVFAWTVAIPREPVAQCDSIRVVQFLAIPEPAPLIKSPPLGWPLLDRQRADDAKTVVAKQEEPVADEPAPARHRRHLRRHRRRG